MGRNGWTTYPIVATMARTSKEMAEVSATVLNPVHIRDRVRAITRARSANEAARVDDSPAMPVPSKPKLNPLRRRDRT